MTLSTKQQRIELITRYFKTKQEWFSWISSQSYHDIKLLLKDAKLIDEQFDKKTLCNEIMETGLFVRKTHNNVGVYFHTA